MSQNLSFTGLVRFLGINIPSQLLQELEHDLDQELQSTTLYEDTLSTLEELKKSGLNWHYAQI